MKLISFLLGREESLKSFGMSPEPMYSILSLLLFLVFNAASIVMLELKITCSTELISDKVRAFLEIKSSLSLYSWLIISLSWLFSCLLFINVVPARLSMRRRKYFYILGGCSVVYALSGGINTLLLLILPGRIISCEGIYWKDLLLKFLGETLNHFSTFPNSLVPLISAISIFWFTFLFYRIHRVSFGLSKRDSLLYSVGFTLIFFLSSSVLIGLASALILSLPSL